MDKKYFRVCHWHNWVFENWN